MTAAAAVAIPLGVRLALVFADGQRRETVVNWFRNGWAQCDGGWQVRVSAVVRVEVGR